MRFIFLSIPVFCTVLAASVPVRAQNAVAATQPDSRQNASQLHWLEASPATRAGIVSAWQGLPATTRPPFPLYRDKALKNAVHKTTGQLAAQK